MRTTPLLPPPSPNLPPRGEPGDHLVPASDTSRLVTFCVVGLATILFGAAIGQEAAAAATVVVLGGSILIGLGLGSDRLFRSLPGWVAGPLATLLLVIVLAMLFSRSGGTPPVLICVLVGAAVVGLDWAAVPRLRAVVVLSGLLAAAVVGADAAWALPGALAWFAGALVAVALLERDARQALPRPEPLVDTGGRRPSFPAGELATTIAAAAGIALLVALLVGNPSCNLLDRDETEAGGSPSTSFGSGGGRGSQGSVGSGSSGGGRQTGGEQRYYELGDDGRERELHVDEDGRTYVEGEDGQRYVVEQDDGAQGRTTVRDEQGDVVAVIEPDGTGGSDVSVVDEQGRTQTFEAQPDGSLTFEGGDGQRYELRVDERGRPVVTDGSGQPVPGAYISGDHLYARDPNGQVLVPSQDGGDGIPLPPSAVREQYVEPPGADGQQIEQTPDGTKVTDRDGSSRTYSTDEQGRDRVTVREPSGEERTYVYDDSGEHTYVYEYDENGDIVRDYVIDPEGRIEGESDIGPQPPGTTPRPSTTATPVPDESRTDDESINWWLVAGLVAAAVAAGALAWWLVRRRRRDAAVEVAHDAPARDWAESVLHVLEVEGGRRGRPRSENESIVTYAEVLGGGVLLDDRLGGAGRVVSAAFFGRSQPSAAAREWVEAVVADAVERNPLDPDDEDVDAGTVSASS